jgi:hypothetical protein
MHPLERMESLMIQAEALLQDVKEGVDQITVSQARDLYSGIREIEGWLQSARKLLEPPGVL